MTNKNMLQYTHAANECVTPSVPCGYNGCIPNICRDNKSTCPNVRPSSGASPGRHPTSAPTTSARAPTRGQGPLDWHVGPRAHNAHTCAPLAHAAHAVPRAPCAALLRAT